jgi:hypothetical protein
MPIVYHQVNNVLILKVNIYYYKHLGATRVWKPNLPSTRESSTPDALGGHQRTHRGQTGMRPVKRRVLVLNGGYPREITCVPSHMRRDGYTTSYFPTIRYCGTGPELQLCVGC